MQQIMDEIGIEMPNPDPKVKKQIKKDMELWLKNNEDWQNMNL